MGPSTSEFQIAMAELLASLARRMGVLHAAAHAAGLLHTPPPRLPDRVADHVRYYKGLFTKYPQLGPPIEDLLERYQQAGKDLARVEAEAEDAAEALERLYEHERFLSDLPAAFPTCPPLQQFFAPKAPPAPPTPPPRPATGRLMPMVGRPPTRPLFPENQALLDKGLATLRALDARLMLIRAACAMAANPAAPPSLALPPQAREAAKRLSAVAAADPEALATLGRLVEQHTATKKLFDQRPLQQPEAARAALEQLSALAGALDNLPAVARLLEGR